VPCVEALGKENIFFLKENSLPRPLIINSYKNPNFFKHLLTFMYSMWFAESILFGTSILFAVGYFSDLFQDKQESDETK
jgi:hypothetical protein